jgi:hypothetical protein
MSKNKVQFQKGMSLPDFLKEYGTEVQCREMVFRSRWPKGFFDAPTVAMTTIVKSEAAIVSNAIVAIAKPRCFRALFTNKRSYH